MQITSIVSVYLFVLLTGVAVAQTTETDVCAGQTGAAWGLCNAYCNAMNCDTDDPQASQEACDKVSANFQEITGQLPPCSALTYFYTCGDPVCMGFTDDPAIPSCTTQQVGAPCSTSGEICEFADTCNVKIVCAATDPVEGGCPISRKVYKTAIEYLDTDGLKLIHDELMKFRLATYQYKAQGDGALKQLGFMIEDVEPSPSIDSSGGRVNLYGYVSMAVAALQRQAQQIDTLDKQVELLRRELEVLKASGTPAQ